MEEYTVTPEKLRGKKISELAVNENTRVIKFTDNTYLDVYVDKNSQTLKTSTNKLES